jgi:Protein of unknown function (DUF2846)
MRGLLPYRVSVLLRGGGRILVVGGVMLWRIVVLSIVGVLISGCVTTRSGTSFGSLSQKVGPGQARIVVFREQAYGGLFDQGWDVKLDGQPMGDLKTGTYVYADRPAGRHQLSSEMVGFPGVTQRDIVVTAGRTHFFLAKPSDRAKTLQVTSAAGGLTGLVVGAAITSGDSNPGPLDFIPLEEGAARQAIAELRLAE